MPAILGQVTRLSQAQHEETNKHAHSHFTPTDDLEMPHRGHANYTEKGPWPESNSQLSRCEATVPATKEIWYQQHIPDESAFTDYYVRYWLIYKHISSCCDCNRWADHSPGWEISDELNLRTRMGTQMCSLTPVQLLVSVDADVVMGSRKPFGSPSTPAPFPPPAHLWPLNFCRVSNKTGQHSVTLTGCCRAARKNKHQHHLLSPRGCETPLGNPLTSYGDGGETTTLDEPICLMS